MVNYKKRLTARKKFKDDEVGIVGIGTLIVFIAMVLVAAIAAAVIINTAVTLEQQARQVGTSTAEELGVGIYVRGCYGRVNQNPADTATYQKIVYLTLYISLLPGSSGIDLRHMLVRVITHNRSGDLMLAELKKPNIMNAPYSIARIAPEYYTVTSAIQPRAGYFYVYDQYNQSADQNAAAGAPVYAPTGSIAQGVDPYNAFNATATTPRYGMDQATILAVRIWLGGYTFAQVPVSGTNTLNSPLPPCQDCKIEFVPATGSAVGVYKFTTPSAYGISEVISL